MSRALAVTVGLTLLASGAGAAPHGSRPHLALGKERRICIHEDIYLDGVAGAVQADFVRAVVRGALEDRLNAVGREETVWPGAHPAQPIDLSDPAICDAAGGDVIVRLTMSVDRPKDRYTIRLVADDGRRAHYDDQVVREHARRGPGRTLIVPDERGPDFDDWAYAVRAAVTDDALTLGVRLFRKLSFN